MDTDPGVRFVLALVAVIILTVIAYLVLVVARWIRQRSEVHYVTSRPLRPAQNARDDRRFIAISRAETNYETDEPHPSVAEIEAEKIAFAETEVARALARLIIAEKLGLTDAVKIGVGKKSGEAYQRASGLVKAAMAEQQPRTPIADRLTDGKFASDKVSS